MEGKGQGRKVVGREDCGEEETRKRRNEHCTGKTKKTGRLKKDKGKGGRREDEGNEGLRRVRAEARKG